MMTVGCAGFPVPATRYFKEFFFVEVQETHLGTPGPGTVRRWRREAPEGFHFALLAPREIGQDAFRAGKVAETAMEMMSKVGNDLSAEIAVFLAPTDFSPTKANRTSVKEFLIESNKRFPTVVFDPGPLWEPDDAEALIEGHDDILIVRDPLKQGISQRPRAYYRLPGPAGRKSRYEDPVIEQLADIAAGATHEDVTYVFANVDMFADAKRFRKAVKSRS